MSYAGLIEDHEHIERCADLLTADLSRSDVGAEQIARRLHDLAVFVNDHVAIEEGIVAICDAKPLPAPWRAAWIDGLRAFEHLRADWLDFLNDWTVETIAHDLDHFRIIATDILGRLKDRVKLETTALYAVALQTGAIVFK